MPRNKLLIYLQSAFAQRKTKNPKYSLRAFAQSLNIDSSTLSAILGGKRPITAKRAVKILERLEIKDDMRRELDLACACCRTGATNGVR